MHLLNESWTPCPVKDSFSVFQLQEYFGLQAVHQQDTPNSTPSKTSNWDGDLCPFDLENLDNLLQGQEDLFAPAGKDSSSEDELKRDFVEEGDFVASTPSRKFRPKQSSVAPALPPPVITTTSLMVLRLCGKYLRVMQMLQTISVDVFNAITQLVEYYFINVHHMFASDLKSESHHTVPSYKLTALVKRINRTLIKARLYFWNRWAQGLPALWQGHEMSLTWITN